MKPAIAFAIIPAFSFALGISPVCAQSPEASPAGFDCAKANAPLEKTICANKTLAMLDRETTRVLTLTREDASVSQPNILKAQDIWIKQRAECMSSTDKERCLAESYVGRISTLRSDSRAARAAKAGISLGPFNAECDNGNTSLSVVFVNSEPSYAYVAGRKDNIVLKQALSGSGARYEAQYPRGQARLWNKGNAAQIALPGGKDMSCTMTPAGK